MNLYSILNLEPSASRAEIRVAWLRECKLHHPDTGGDPERMALINQAYSILSDPVKRQAYDSGRDPFAPDPLEALISATLVGVFNAVVNDLHADLEYLDLIGRMKSMIIKARNDMLRDMEQSNIFLCRQKAIARKLKFSGSGINPLHGHLQQSIDTTIKNLQTAAEQRKGMKLALEYLDNYAFEFKVREQTQGYGLTKIWIDEYNLLRR